MSKSNRKAFSLIELIIAITILSVGVVGTYSLLPNVIKSVSFNLKKATASQLAREGIETVRNIRDGNWIEIRNGASISWDEGITGGNHLVQYDQGQLLSYENKSLRENSSGFYVYDCNLSDAGCSKTSFKRKVNINKPDGDTIEVEVVVTWKGQKPTSEADNSFTVQETLKNYR